MNRPERSIDRITLDLADDDGIEVELAQLRAGLGRRPRELSSRYFYDETGSALFELICTLPEYYQTRTEHALLEEHASRLAETTGAEEIVEIGAGAAIKTRTLLRAVHETGRLRLYVPLDVDESMLRRVAGEICDEFPRVRVHAVGGDFLKSLERLPPGGRRIFLFLGGTIGNLHPDDGAPAFVSAIRDDMSAGDHLLIGVDLIKERARIEAAYNDSRGVTADFNRNILHVVNARFGADFHPASFDHDARWNADQRWIEMRLIAQRPQRVRIEALDLELELAAGEPIRTEISTKYDRARTETLLEQAGLELVEWLSDPDDLFALVLARRDR